MDIYQKVEEYVKLCAARDTALQEEADEKRREQRAEEREARTIMLNSAIASGVVPDELVPFAALSMDEGFYKEYGEIDRMWLTFFLDGFAPVWLAWDGESLCYRWYTPKIFRMLGFAPVYAWHSIYQREEYENVMDALVQAQRQFGVMEKLTAEWGREYQEEEARKKEVVEKPSFLKEPGKTIEELLSLAMLHDRQPVEMLAHSVTALALMKYWSDFGE